MMTRYVTRPKAIYYDDDCDEFILNPETITVEDSDPYIPTGLVDASGNELYRVRAPIGFRLK